MIYTITGVAISVGLNQVSNTVTISMDNERKLKDDLTCLSIKQLMD